MRTPEANRMQQLGKKRPHYSEAEMFFIRRRFNAGESDAQIASGLCSRFGRECGGEAVRKIRRAIGLKKVPTYDRWRWAPATWTGSEVAYG